MKKITKIAAVVIASVAIANVASAANVGPYVGVGLGYSKLETPSLEGFSRSQGGVGGQVFAGFNFVKYFGVEAGYATYARSQYKLQADQSDKVKYTLNAFDVVGKAYLPINDTGFNVYALGGAARVSSTVHTSGPDITLADGSSSKTVHKVRPMYGIGASYDVSSHLTTNLEWSRIQGKGNIRTSDSAIPNADMLSLNVAYNFG